jgi:hypothetical protein
LHCFVTKCANGFGVATKGGRRSSLDNVCACKKETVVISRCHFLAGYSKTPAQTLNRVKAIVLLINKGTLTGAFRGLLATSHVYSKHCKLVFVRS